MTHAAIAPVLVPSACAALMILVGDRRLGLQRALGLASYTALVLIAVAAVFRTSAGAIDVYRVGDWPAPFGIVLVLDRLAALLLAFTIWPSPGGHSVGATRSCDTATPHKPRAAVERSRAAAWRFHRPPACPEIAAASGAWGVSRRASNLAENHSRLALGALCSCRPWTREARP
jgi:hypothetical protein